MQTQSGSPRHTDVLLGLKCPMCASSLSLMPGRVLLSLHCKSGHSFPMRQLLQAQAEGVERRVESVLAAWEDKLAILEQSAEFARREGREELRLNFEREAQSLRERMRNLREHLDDDGGQHGGAIAG